MPPYPPPSYSPPSYSPPSYSPPAPAGGFGAAPITRPISTASQLDATPLMSYSRWKKSSGTFGPVGRVVATLLLLIPLPVLAMAASVGVGIIGGGIYVLVIMPWALRDIWQRAAIPIEAPAPTAPVPRF